MTEYESKMKEEMASAFIVNTCQLLPKTFSISAVPDHMHDSMLSNDPATTAYSILCGSHAEFFIRPLNTCIADDDDLISKADELACIGDIPVLPSDISGLSDKIECYKIEKYNRYPGFVRLRVIGQMNYNWKNKKYVFNQTALLNSYKTLNLTNLAKNEYLPLSKEGSTLINTVSGPSIKGQPNRNHHCAGDTVLSVWCPQWPKDAQNWPTRPRNQGWPTTATISEVVQNGCHVVYVQHRSCRDDNLQWRLSFSFVEVILLQSWTQIQQIVYHLLRFFCKRELIQKDCPKEDEVLCTYHLKTLMLWTCEEMSPEWCNSSSVIAICCELLKKLLEWLKRRNCPNYFIPEANLFHEEWSPKMCEKSERRLNTFCEPDILCDWFVENYILPYIRTHFEENILEVNPHFEDYMLPLFISRKPSELISLDSMFIHTFTCSYNIRLLMENSLSSGLRLKLKSANSLKNLSDKVHNNMSHYLTIENVLCHTNCNNVLYILHTAYGLGCGEISWNSRLFIEFVDGILQQPKIVRSQYHNFPKMYTEQSSRFQFLRAQDLMENLTGSNCSPEFKLVSLMSKEFLTKAVECDCCVCTCIAPAALAYLAALNFATTEYQQAIRLCMAVLVNQTFQKVKETLNAGCLLFIDDVARIVGLCVLQKKITGNNLYYINRRLCLDLRLSPKMFAYYLTVLSVERIFKYLETDRELPDSAFPMDEFLKAFIKPKCIVLRKPGFNFNVARECFYLITDSLTETESTSVNPLIVKERVIDILMEYAIENMTSFHNLINEDFGIQCNTVDCYRALYLYKCRQYDEALLLCERILHEPDLQSDLQQFSFVNVLLMPPLDSFFDRDIQSLLGFHTLFYYLSPTNDEMQECNITTESTFAQYFGHIVRFHGRLLYQSLQFHYSIKCNYFVGRHFLATYLKVRICIDCNLPLTEALTAFAAQKTNLPFEQIIRRFLLQKLRIIKK